MNFIALELLVAAVMFVGMVLVSVLGRRRGLSRLRRHPEGLPKGGGAAEGVIFALLGLLMAFSFNGAATRFEGRRHLITEETNAIGTAYLRIEALPEDTRERMREKFRHYLDVRLETYRLAGNIEAAMAKYAEGISYQEEIWTEAVTAARRSDAHTATMILVLPSLNAMFDIATTRLAATRSHPPVAVFVVLFLMGLYGAFLIGFNSSIDSTGSRFHARMFSFMVAFMILLIIDLEFPRQGFIQVTEFDRLLIELRQGMK